MLGFLTDLVVARILCECLITVRNQNIVSTKYSDGAWQQLPFYSANNINHVRLYTLNKYSENCDAQNEQHYKMCSVPSAQQIHRSEVYAAHRR